ncbi:MAG: hypothetical protein J7L26_12150, partial [Candidatus Aminicenantes bacterium]|nr:hypothetical protein [Candidatus Aminicenantes bacterium]
MRKIVCYMVFLIFVFGLWHSAFGTNYWIEDRDDVVPAYLWTCGCTPTSAMMVLGYYDYESPTGKFLGYGLLVQQYM